MDPGALGDGISLDCEVLGERLAGCEMAWGVQSHGLLQAGVQVGHLCQISRANAGLPPNAVDFLQ